MCVYKGGGGLSTGVERGAFKGGVQQGFGTQFCYEAPSDLWVKQVLKTQWFHITKNTSS